DGDRGKEFAQKARRSGTQKYIAPEELTAASAGGELHVVGTYKPIPDGGDAIDVEIRPTKMPVGLVLASYLSVLWQLKLAPGAQIKAVVVPGCFPQEIEGIPEDVPIVSRFTMQSNDSQNGQKDLWFYAFDAKSIKYRTMVDWLNDVTGLLVSTFQGKYEGD